MATIEYLAFTPVKFGATEEACGAIGDFCDPIHPTDPISFQTIVNPTQTEVSFSMADFTGTNWTVTDGVLIHTPGSTAVATLAGVFTVLNRYRLRITVSNMTAGDVDFGLGSASSTTARLLNIQNNLTFYFYTAAVTTGDLIITPTSAFDGSIVIEEIIDATYLRFGTERIDVDGDFATATSWSGGTGWSHSSGVWTKVAGVASNLQQTSTINPKIKPGKSYRMVLSITRSAGTMRLITGNPNYQESICFGRSYNNTQVYELNNRGYIDIDANPSTDYVIGLEADAAFAGTVEYFEIYEVEEDIYKLINCDTDEEVADIPNDYIDRVNDERTIVQIPSIGQLATATNLITDGNFDSPLHEGTATNDTGATFEDSGVDFSDVAGDNLIKNDTDGLYDWVESVSGDEVTTWNTLVQTGEDYTIWRWRVGAGASWEIYDGYALHIPDNESTFYQGVTINTNSRYIAKVTISNYVSGSIQLLAGSPNFSEAISGNGSHSVVIETGASATQFFIVLPTSDFDARITGLELYESLEDGKYKICSYNRFGTLLDVNLLNDAESRFDIQGNGSLLTSNGGTSTITGGQLILDGSSNVGSVAGWAYNSAILTSGFSYTITIDVADLEGELQFYQTTLGSLGVFSTLIGTIDTNGTHSFTFECTGVNTTFNFGIVGANEFATIDNLYIRLAEEEIFTQDECSQCFCLSDDCPDCSALLSWNSDSNMNIGSEGNYIDYTSDPTFKFYQRAIAVLQKPKYPKTNNTYLTSAGTKKMVTSFTDKSKELFVDFSPEYVHDSIGVGLGNDNFYVDNVPYAQAEDDDYEPEFRDKRNLMRARVDLRPKTLNNKKTSC